MLRRFVLLFLLAGLLLVACSRNEPDQPTIQAEEQVTPEATATKRPTPVPASPTPPPTATPSPTPEPVAAVSAIQQALDEDGQIVVSSVTATEPGWLAVHRQEDGQPGAVIGYTAVSEGEHQDVPVTLNPYDATDTLYVSLHRDTGEEGTFDYPDADPLVEQSGEPLLVEVEVDMRVPLPTLVVSDQTISREGGQVVVDTVTAPGPAWLVLYTDADGELGTRLGQTWVEEGESEQVAIDFDWHEATRNLHVVLQEDQGSEGRFEPDLDQPIVLRGDPLAASFTATLPIDVFVMAQPVVSDTVVLERVVSNEPGWVVVYSDFVGLPADPLGHAPIEAGVNEQVVVPIENRGLTPLLHVMVHSDAGTIGEFDNTVVDPALRDENRMLLFSFETQSGGYLLTEDQVPGADDTVQVPLVVTDVETWVAIHADDDGVPGEILGQAWLPAGVHRNVSVPIDVEEATPTLYAALYQDLGEIETFEFPEGPDIPLTWELREIQAPFSLLAAGEQAEE